MEDLTVDDYDEKSCSEAIDGAAVPATRLLVHGFTVTRLCLIRGIRYHPGFAAEMRTQQGVDPAIIRALNARAVMSGELPEMGVLEEMPYCIWHPDLAPEETYRKLAARYPQMRYQAGRACAVAGYLDLYLALHLLPDVSIAEEAREAKNEGSQAIFEHIMAQPARYAVMDDYTRTIHLAKPRPGACLNGDTAVRASLDIKQKFKAPEGDDLLGIVVDEPVENEPHFDMTEDMSIDTFSSEPPREPEDVSLLLTSPLPPDLPTLQKDLLILVAAYNGDIDRYHRLHRPMLVRSELECLVRGIYNNSLFAAYIKSEGRAKQHDRVSLAIAARAIMSNDLSGITAALLPDSLPYCIWHPNVPAKGTLRELLYRQPYTAPQVLRSCIVGGYLDLWGELWSSVEVRKHLPAEELTFLACEARDSGSRAHFCRDLEQRAVELGVDLTKTGSPGWKMLTSREAVKSNPTMLYGMPLPRTVVTGRDGIYDGVQCRIGAVELCATTSEKRPKDAYDWVEMEEVWEAAPLRLG